MTGIRRHNAFDPAARMDRLAESVANGRSVAEAGEAMNLTKGQASRVWQNIKAGLGWQAC